MSKRTTKEQNMITGSLINSVMASAPVPAVGMGATLLGWSDRHAATVVAVSASGKTCKVQQDHAKRVDKNGMSEMQQYEFSPNPNAPVLVVRKTKRGWMSGGLRVALGHRSEYYDFSF